MLKIKAQNQPGHKKSEEYEILREKKRVIRYHKQIKLKYKSTCKKEPKYFLKFTLQLKSGRRTSLT